MSSTSAKNKAGQKLHSIMPLQAISRNSRVDMTERFFGMLVRNFMKNIEIYLIERSGMKARRSRSLIEVWNFASPCNRLDISKRSG